jgi:hypothetical protein
LPDTRTFVGSQHAEAQVGINFDELIDRQATLRAIPPDNRRQHLQQGEGRDLGILDPKVPNFDTLIDNAADFVRIGPLEFQNRFVIFLPSGCASPFAAPRPVCD